MQVMARRLKDINPEIKVIAKQQFLDPQAARDLAKVPCDFIVDCIDSITPKVGFFKECFVTVFLSALPERATYRRVGPQHSGKQVVGDNECESRLNYPHMASVLGTGAQTRNALVHRGSNW
jgi:hypothetical protein